MEGPKHNHIFSDLSDKTTTVDQKDRGRKSRKRKKAEKRLRLRSNKRLSDKIDPSSSSSTSNSTIPSSSQKQVVIVEKRSNTTTFNNLYYSDTTVDIDFDLSLSQYECGHFKCLIPSKSNQDIGYLVKLLSRRTQVHMSKLIGGWQLAQWIDEQFGDLPNGLHRHFYIDEPFIIQLNETIAKELCKIHGRSQNKNNQKNCKKTKLKVGSMKLENQSVVIGFPVQKVKKIEIDDFLLYKCTGVDYEKFNQKKKEYINNVIKMGNGIEFYKNLAHSYHTLQTLFLLKPAILRDFHALFDQNGNMYFFDLDQDLNEVHPNFVKKRTKLCLKGLDRLMKKTKDYVSEYNHPK